MTIGAVETYIKQQDSDKIISLCNEIYEWREKEGRLPIKSILYEFSVESGCQNIRVLEDKILEEAHRRFGNIVLLLMKDAPKYYLK
ncbi:hypothetical protein [Prevotella sp.]|jgi:hypothetical protein|uniref:hypothetical protein n=1 Tax=Prevotella sp. TaxID=59823 RepID=UPI003AB67C7D